MKRIISFLLVMMLVATGTQAQLLYKISGKGLTFPSYIVGTHHLAPASFADKIPGVQRALSETQQVYGEVVMQEMMSAENLQKIMAAIMLPEGTTLSSLLTADERTRLNAMLRDLMGVDLDNPMVASQLDRFTPVGLSTQLTALLAQRHFPELSAEKQIDGYFQEQAREQLKPVYGLETIEFQIKTLYGADSLSKQKDELMCMVDHQDLALEALKLMTNGYLRQDLNMIEESMDMERNDAACMSTPEDEARLIKDRNNNWMTQLPAIMAAKPTLFAVGAGHLVGEDGMLTLLRKAGYEVTAVK